MPNLWLENLSNISTQQCSVSFTYSYHFLHTSVMSNYTRKIIELPNLKIYNSIIAGTEKKTLHGLSVKEVSVAHFNSNKSFGIFVLFSRELCRIISGTTLKVKHVNFEGTFINSRNVVFFATNKTRTYLY